MTLPFFRSLRGRLLVVLLSRTALLIGSLAYRHARPTIELGVNARLTAIADLQKEERNLAASPRQTVLDAA